MARNTGYRSDPNSFGELGMFGPLPYEVQEMVRQQGMSEDMAVAKMNPNELGVFLGGQAGRAIGGGVASLWGGEDPAVARSKQIKAISDKIRNSGLNPNNFEEFYGKLGEELAGAGFTSEAANVANALQSYKDKQADLEIKKDQVEAIKARKALFSEGKLKHPIAQMIAKNAAQYDPISFAKWAKSVTDENPVGDETLLQAKDAKATQDWELTGRNTKGPDGKLYPLEYNKKTGETRVGKVAVEPDSPRTKVDIGLPQMTFENTVEAPLPPNTYSQEDAKLLAAVQTPQILDLTKRAQAAQESLASVAVMKDLVKDGNLITGSLPDVRKELARVGQTLGWPKWNAQVNDSDYFDQFVMDVVLPKMQMLGGQDSNEELRKLTQSAANRSMSPQQLARSLELLEERNQRIIDGQARFQQGLSQGRTDPTTGWDPVKMEWKAPRGSMPSSVGSRKTKETVKDLPPGTRPPLASEGPQGAVQGSQVPPQIQNQVTQHLNAMSASGEYQKWKAAGKSDDDIVRAILKKMGVR